MTDLFFKRVFVYKHASMMYRKVFTLLIVLVSVTVLRLYWNYNDLFFQDTPLVESKEIAKQRDKRIMGNDSKLTTHVEVQLKSESGEKTFVYHEVNQSIYSNEKQTTFNKTENISEHELASNSSKQDEIPTQGKPISNLPKKEEPSAQISESVFREQRWHEALASCANQTKEKRLPDIIGIGTEKCGTGALATFLHYHPLIRSKLGDINVEAHYFNSKSSLGLDHYRSLMPDAERCALVMEKTPAYFSFPPANIPFSIIKAVPDAKLLLILCEPAKRAFSDFIHEWEMETQRIYRVPGIRPYDKIEKYLKLYLPAAAKKIRPLNEITPFQANMQLLKWQQRDMISTILTTGLYARHLTRWLRYYNETNLMIINGEELFQDPGGVIEKVQDFLGVPKLILRSDFVKNQSTGYYCYRDWIKKKMFCLAESKQRTRGGKHKCDQETMQMLKSFYQRHNEDLFKLLGRRFDWQ